MSEEQEQAQGTERPPADAPVSEQQPEGTVGGETANPEQEANVGSQGEQVATSAVGGDQDTPVAQSPPPPDAQSGVPLQADRDAGVEAQPQYAGPVQGGGAPAAEEQPDAGQGAGTTHPASPAE